MAAARMQKMKPMATVRIEALAKCGVSERDVEQAAKKDWRRINLTGHEQCLSAGEKIAQETAADARQHAHRHGNGGANCSARTLSVAWMANIAAPSASR